MKINICGNCGKEFVAPKTRQNQKYCCYECSRQAKCVLKPKQCPICGKMFQPRVSRDKYCSKSCSDESKRNKFKHSYITTCVECGKSFRTSYSENKKFCCRKCFYDGMSSGKVKTNHKHGTYEELYGKEKADIIRAKLKACKRSEEFKENVRKTQTGRKRSKETCEKLRNIQLSKEHQNKINSTKRKNGTFNTSKEENEINILLRQKFSDVKMQYKSEKYPFNCDFYIPEKDLYIEYQGSWTHGKKPFESSKSDLQKLSKWKNNSIHSKYYEVAIHTWTIRDVNKRTIAKENNLNWIEFFTMKDFLSWFDCL